MDGKPETKIHSNKRYGRKNQESILQSPVKKNREPKRISLKIKDEFPNASMLITKANLPFF